MKIKSKNRAILNAAALAVGIAIALGWAFAPSPGSSTISAANQNAASGATTEMLDYALNFKSASNLGVFGGGSVSDQGSEIRGVVGSAGEITGVAANALSVGVASEARRDLLDTLSYVDQLPCTEINDSNLGGRSFGPGVYCLGSATLAGRMTVDAGGDANARFVFRVNGTFTAEDASSIERIGEAQATNVYIFSRDAARIGGNAAIGGNVISREDVTVGHGSTVTGKVIGVNGDVTTDSNIVAAGTGYVEICKELAQFDRIPVGTIFTFSVSGVAGTIQVPAGAFGSPNCAPPVLVASGNVTVTEQARANTAVVLITATPASRLVSSSLSLQQAVVAVPDGDVANQTVVTFRNQTTRTGTIEICKFAAEATIGRNLNLPADPDVTGFFNFTVQGAPGQVFAVPVGFCSGPITVVILQVNGGPSPSPTQAFNANVTELAQPTFRCENVTTFPATALSLNAGNGFFPDLGWSETTGTTFTNTNGCYANVALNVAGGAANQTTVRFYNRSLPGRIKICKITADPVAIPIGTAFTFQVTGLAGPLPGTPAVVLVDVLAGPDSQGGFCAFVPGTWIVGSPVDIVEIGVGPLPIPPLPRGVAERTSTDNSLTGLETRDDSVVRAIGFVGVGRDVAGRPMAGPWFVSTTGNDANDCLSLATACLTLQAAVNKASAGDTINVAAGSYTENVSITKSLTLNGAQAGVDARGRAAAESIFIPAAALTATFNIAVTGTFTIDGFSFSGGPTGSNGVIFTSAGPHDNLKIVNNRFSGYPSAAVWMNRGGSDITIDKNVMDGSNIVPGSTAQAIFANGPQSYAGLFITNNNIINNANRYGFFVDGNHNVGESATRAPSISGNVFDNNLQGLNLGSRSFGTLLAPVLPAAVYGGFITNNTFSNNTANGVQAGIQHVLVSGNTFSNNVLSGLALTSFGNTGVDRGAQNSLIVGNTFINNAIGQTNQAGIFFSGTQGVGLIGTNEAHFNRIVGNGVGIQYGSSINAGNNATINVENNWWGCNYGPGTGGTGCTGTPNGTLVFAGNTGVLDSDPWIVEGVSASPSTINAFATSTVTADMTMNSNMLTPVGGPVVNMPVAFSATNGTMSPTTGTITSGLKASTFTSTNTSSGTGCATVDSQLVCANITVIPPMTNGIPDPTFADVRVSRIRSSTTLIPAGTSIFNKTARILARNTTAEVEFTNFIYRPAILKLCKTSNTIPVGTPFSFTIAPADPLTTWPYPTGTITVPVGSCTFVNGPFPPNAAFDNIGLFNYGKGVVVTENAAPGTAVLGITSPTLTGTVTPGTLIVDLNNRRGTITLNQPLLPNNRFNELSFANGPASAPPRTDKARFDFDGDHASDIALFRPSDGNWYYNASGSGSVRAVHFGQAGDIPVAGDYDGDGTTDPAVYRNGQWFVLGSTAGFSSLSFGLATDIPQVGDYDGDSKADFAVFRQSNGSWYIMGSASGFRAVQFGIATDIPAAADFDGDGKTDPAVYRNGTWFINGSSAGFSGVQFGIAGDKPVEADYDGDGRDDVAVYRNGSWYVMGSTAGFSATQFGNSTDTPVPADYDGDGKTDVAVYRSSNTNWYILNSSQAGNAVGGFSSMQFGSSGDMLMNY